jgi:hypothetical protein
MLSYLNKVYQDTYKLLYLYNKLTHEKKPEDVTYERLFKFALLTCEISYYYKESHTEEHRDLLSKKFSEIYADDYRYINFYAKINDKNDILYDLAQDIRIIAGIDVYIYKNILEDNYNLLLLDILQLINSININYKYFLIYLREKKLHECINFDSLIEEIDSITLSITNFVLKK